MKRILFLLLAVAGCAHNSEKPNSENIHFELVSPTEGDVETREFTLIVECNHPLLKVEIGGQIENPGHANCDKSNKLVYDVKLGEKQGRNFVSLSWTAPDQKSTFSQSIEICYNPTNRPLCQ